MSVNREIQVARRSPKSVPHTATSASRSSSMSGSPAWSTCRSMISTRKRLPVRGRTERMGADAVVTEAELRFPVHLDLGDHPAGRGIQPDEVDARGLADQAASAVASDEVLRSERGVVGQIDIDARVVLRTAHHLAAAEDRDLELTDPVGQDRLEQALPQREHVVVAGGEVADVEADPARTRARGGWIRRRGTAPRCHADRAPRWSGTGDPRRASRRRPGWRVVRR